jgi:Fe-S-cluster containining protein
MFSLGLNENIAEVTVNPKTKRVTKIFFHQKHLRFKCQRCAVFCCKLGGPKLTEKDVNYIEQAGHRLEEFLELVSTNEFKGLPIMCDRLKSKDDGSCVFISFDVARNVYECSIFEVKPALCRLNACMHPFDFERITSTFFMLKLIPCCKGLYKRDRELVNKSFVNKKFNVILDLITRKNQKLATGIKRS